jgi:hypothetical protein
MSALLLHEEAIAELVCAGLLLCESDGQGPLLWIRPKMAFDASVPPGVLAVETAPRVVRELALEHERSILSRYGSLEAAPGPQGGARFGDLGIVLDPSEPESLLKAIACYTYQTCEDDHWPASEARAFCDALVRRCEMAARRRDAIAFAQPDTA